mmetsp:Transcript_34186/g.48587  ORF Transcript_34186/g.48587 Transcript_34186/m.48587 type:complete len:247 (-) Transcript_34186:291-1031(-)
MSFLGGAVDSPSTQSAGCSRCTMISEVSCSMAFIASDPSSVSSLSMTIFLLFFNRREGSDLRFLGFFSSSSSILACGVSSNPSMDTPTFAMVEGVVSSPSSRLGSRGFSCSSSSSKGIPPKSSSSIGNSGSLKPGVTSIFSSVCFPTRLSRNCEPSVVILSSTLRASSTSLILLVSGFSPSFCSSSPNTWRSSSGSKAVHCSSCSSSARIRLSSLSIVVSACIARRASWDSWAGGSSAIAHSSVGP